MPHDADFADAHRRHWEDAELLHEHERWANADQMYGFSTECGLKAVMRILGMDIDEIGRPVAQEHRMHVQDLWPEFISFAEEKDGARYLGLLPHDGPFKDWSHHDRYANRAHFSEAGTIRHREAARKILAMVELAVEDNPP